MTAPSRVRSLPYATLLAFTRYVDRTGPAKASFVGGLRRQRETGGGFNPHGQLIKALKADLGLHTGGAHVAAIAGTVGPRWRRLYAMLAAGATRYLESLGDRTGYDLLPTREVLAMVGELPVKISAHFGLRHADGRVEAVRMYFDEEPPTAEVVTATLYLMNSYMDQILPHAQAVVLDVRRGVTHRARPLRGGTDDVDRWLTGEAAGFSAMWTAPA